MRFSTINKKEVLQCIVATFLIGLGVSLFIACQLGSDTITIFLDGMNRSFHISVGLMDQILTLFLFLLAFLLNRKGIGLCSVLNTLCIGICITISQGIVDAIEIESASFIVRMLGVVVAQACITFSYAWLQTFSQGMSITDVLLYTAMKKFNLNYITVRIVFDGTFVIVGVLLHGIIGIGTIFSLITMGCFTSFFKHMIETRQGMKKTYDQAISV